MGQITGTAVPATPRRFIHSQEITHSADLNEWKSLRQRTVEVEETNPGAGSECKASMAPWTGACCASDDAGPFCVEEVLVVHHDALKNINFLLRVDELSGCALPSPPECVIAAKHAELQKRHVDLMKETAASLADRQVDDHNYAKGSQHGQDISYQGEDSDESHNGERPGIERHLLMELVDFNAREQGTDVHGFGEFSLRDDPAFIAADPGRPHMRGSGPAAQPSHDSALDGESFADEVEEEEYYEVPMPPHLLTN